MSFISNLYSVKTEFCFFSQSDQLLSRSFEVGPHPFVQRRLHSDVHLPRTSGNDAATDQCPVWPRNHRTYDRCVARHRKSTAEIRTRRKNRQFTRWCWSSLARSRRDLRASAANTRNDERQPKTKTHAGPADRYKYNTQTTLWRIALPYWSIMLLVLASLKTVGLSLQMYLLWWQIGLRLIPEQTKDRKRRRRKRRRRIGGRGEGKK